MDNANALQGLAQAGFVAYDEAVVPQTVLYALALVGVGFHFEVMLEHVIHLRVI